MWVRGLASDMVTQYLRSRFEGFGVVKNRHASGAGRSPEWNSPEIVGILAAMSSILGHLYRHGLSLTEEKGVANFRG